MKTTKSARSGLRLVASRCLAGALAGAFVLAPGPAARAQSAAEQVDLGTVDRIKKEALERSQIAETLSYLTDVYGPRLTGSPNLRAAEEWSMARLRAWGLQNVHLEAWGPFGRGWSLEGFTANMVAPSFSPLIAYPRAWSPSTDGTVRGDAVYLDAKTPADLERYRGKLKGAIVLLAPPRAAPAHFEPQARRLSAEELVQLANAGPPADEPHDERSPEQRAQFDLAVRRWQFVYEEHAAVVLQPGRGDGGTIGVQDVTIPGPPGTPPDAWPRPWAANAGAGIPQAVVAAEHYNRIVRLLSKGIRVQLEVGIKSRFYDDDPMSYNLIAEIPGTDLKDEVVMLGGCLDSWHAGTGATDNAAGAVVCLEAVRILQALGVKPRRTIRIALWSGEEQGELGSHAYVAEHFGVRRAAPNGASVPGSRPAPLDLKPEYEKLSCYFNFDYGTGKLRGVYLQGNEAVRPIFRAWLAPFADLGASTLSLANAGDADHVPFDEIGLPAFQFIRDEIEYSTRSQHTNMDVFERVQQDDLQQAAIIAAAFIYDAAMRDGRLPRKAPSSAK